MGTHAKTEALTNADAHLNEANPPTYSALVALLNEVAHLSLDFDIGTAYIRRAYIDKQAELKKRISEVNDAVRGA